MSDNNCQLYLGDCLEVMKQIPDGSIDAVIADPPYGTTACAWDSIIPLEPMWEQLKRVIKKNGAIVLFGGQPFTSVLIASNLKMFKQVLVWEKNISSNFLNANRQHMVVHEDICLFYKAQPVFNKQFRDGESYIIKRKVNDDTGDCYGHIKKRTHTVCDYGRNPNSILRFNRETGLHPTQKPVALMEYLIKTYTKEGETVLDFAAGSGATGIAAINTKRNFILIEKDPVHYETAKNRIAAHQGDMTVTTGKRKDGNQIPLFG